MHNSIFFNIPILIENDRTMSIILIIIFVTENYTLPGFEPLLHFGNGQNVGADLSCNGGQITILLP